MFILVESWKALENWCIALMLWQTEISQVLFSLTTVIMLGNLICWELLNVIFVDLRRALARVLLLQAKLTCDLKNDLVTKPSKISGWLDMKYIPSRVAERVSLSPRILKDNIKGRTFPLQHRNGQMSKKCLIIAAAVGGTTRGTSGIPLVSSSSRALLHTHSPSIFLRYERRTSASGSLWCQKTFRIDAWCSSGNKSCAYFDRYLNL